MMRRLDALLSVFTRSLLLLGLTVLPTQEADASAADPSDPTSSTMEAMTTETAESSDTASTEATPEALQAEVEAADQRLNQAARERDRDTFQSLLDPDTVFLAGELHRGRLAVLAIWQHLFDGKYDFRYEGDTVEVVVAQSGDLAWTLGSARTSFQRPGLDESEVIDGHYLHLWKPDANGAWRLVYNASLVVHPTLGAARDPRSGLMTAWPELADQVGARIDLVWNPLDHVVAASGEVAFTFGEYSASFGAPRALEPKASAEASTEPSDATDTTETNTTETNTTETNTTDTDTKPLAGTGNYLAVWQKDAKGHWQLAGEGFTPPGIYGGN